MSCWVKKYMYVGGVVTDIILAGHFYDILIPQEIGDLINVADDFINLFLSAVPAGGHLLVEVAKACAEHLHCRYTHWHGRVRELQRG